MVVDQECAIRSILLTFPRQEHLLSDSLTSTSRQGVEGDLRVDAGALDKLMTLVGELVVSRNELVQAVDAVGTTELLASSQRISHITTELQDGVMATRLQPIGVMWTDLPALVAAFADAEDKSVRLVTEGEDTEIDRAVLESLRGPRTSLVRDVLSHGVATIVAR